MPDLTNFLLDKIAEDEELAQGLRLSWQRWVLAECEAKRRIIARQQHAADAQRQGVINPASIATEIAWTDALRLLAQPYADHADFDPSWRVE